MRSFNLGSFENDDGWFRVGGIAATTTIIVTAISVMTMFLFAIEGRGGPVLGRLSFLPDAVFNGQIWRLFTWAIPAMPFGMAPSIWSVLALFFYFYFGSMLERMMGRQLYTILLAAIAIMPAIVMTVLSLFYNENFGIGVGYLGLLEVGVLCAFICANPTIRFFGSIPGWVLAAIFVGIDVLRYLGDQQYSLLLFELLIVAVAVLGVRAMGFAEDTTQIPKVPLPPSLGGSPYRKADAARNATKKNTRPKDRPVRKKKNRSNLRAVPSAPTPSVAEVNEKEMDDLLDLVSSGGLESLTPEQRRRLEELSKRLKGDS